MSWWRGLWTQIWLTLVVGLVVLALFASLGRQLMPLIETYRSELTALLSEQFEQPVSLGRLQGGWQFLSPTVTLHELNIGPDDDGVYIHQLHAELDISASFFYRQPVFKRIDVEGLHATIVQQSEFEWQLAEGWLLDTTPSIDKPTPSAERIKRPAWLTWLELQQAIVMRHWQIHHQSLVHTEHLYLTQLTLQNQGNFRAFDGDIAWGREDLAHIRLIARMQGPIWPWKQQSGNVYLQVDQQDWTRWIPDEIAGHLSIPALQAGVEAWLDIRHGDLNGLYLEALVPEFQLHSAEQQLTLTQGHLLLEGRRRTDDWHVRLIPAFQETLPFSEVRLSSITLDPHLETPSKGWQIGIPTVDLARISRFITDHQLLAEHYLEYLHGLALEGQANNLRLSLLPNAPDAIANMDLRADVFQPQSQDYRGIPAISAQHAHVHLQPLKGRVDLRPQALDLHLTDLYHEHWAFEQASGQVFWAIHPDFYQLRVHNIKALLDETQVNVDFAMRIPVNDTDIEPNLSLLLGLERAPMAMHKRWVPYVLDQEILDWLDSALLAGRLGNATFVLNGNLELPFEAQASTVQLYLDFDEAQLQYLDDWPHVTNAKGRLFLDSPELDVWVERGSTLGGQLEAHSTRVRLRDSEQGTRLSVVGKIAGDGEEALAYFTDTPLRDVVDNAFDDWQASGPIQAGFSLHVPLGADGIEPTVVLDAHLLGTDVQLTDLDVHFTALQGRVRFDSEQGLSSSSLTGSTFAGDFNARIESLLHTDGYDIQLTADGHAQWSAIKTWNPLFLLDPIQGHLDYQAQLLIRSQPRGGVQLTLNSDLLGTDINLPAPLAKQAAEPKALALVLEPRQELRFSLEYGRTLSAVMALNAAGLDRGQVYLGEGRAFLPSDPGIHIRGAWDDHIDGDAWWDAWLYLSALLDETSTQGQAIGIEAQADHNPLRSVDVRIGNIDLWGTPTGLAHIRAQQQWNEWRIQLDSPLARGDITILPTAAPMLVDMTYIHFPQTMDDPEVIAVNNGRTPDPLVAMDPRDLPALNVRVGEVFVGGYNLGRWHVSSVPVGDGLQLTIHESDMRDMRVVGDVDWWLRDDQHITRLDTLQLSSRNLAAVQRAFRMEPLIEGRDMRSSLQMQWQGSPLAFNTESLEGLAVLRIENGTMITDGAGALKAFGALNFSSISRRLKLDFSDLYETGVAFDLLRARASIEQGLLTLTEPLVVDGPGGKFLLSGRTDLNDTHLDMRLAVTFPVSSTLPLVAILAGMAPPVAASIYVTEKLIGDELARFTSASYVLKGTWQEPDLRLNQAFDNRVDGYQRRSMGQRILSIFGVGSE